MVILKRDSSLWNVLPCTDNEISNLLSDDSQSVAVPLVHLLGASSLVRSMVVDANLHPAIHGPLILSFPVEVGVLLSVGEIFRRGETWVRDGEIEEVQEVLNMLGVEVYLSCSKIKKKYERIADFSEEVKFEIVFEMENENLNDEIENIADQQDTSTENYTVQNDALSEVSANSWQKMHINNKSSDKYECSKRSPPKEKMYRCEVCSFTTSWNVCLKRHNRIDTGEKPYKCVNCNFACSRGSSLKRHIKSYHNKNL